MKLIVSFDIESVSYVAQSFKQAKAILVQVNLNSFS